MKKILLPAVAGLMLVAAPAAFAQTSGAWFVLSDTNTHACYTANRAASPGEQAMGGPYASQDTAQSAMGGILACGGQWQP